MCRWLGSLLTPPFEFFCPPEGQKLPKHEKNQQGSRHSLFSQIWGFYIFFKAMNADKWLWPIFGCKVGQSVPIGMKLELDVQHRLLHVYAKFQTDISKHVEKSPEKNPKRTKIIAKILKIIFSQKTELMSRGIQQATCVPNLKNLSWFMRPWLQKMGLTYFWL